MTSEAVSARPTLSLITWGHPSDPRTFSGCSRNLVAALARRGVLGNQYSAKRLTPLDVLGGAISVRRRGRRVKAEVRRDWMWSDAGSRAISRRTSRAVRRAGDSGPLLQIGALVDPDPDLGPHLVFTDMTIPQVRRAGMFAVGRLSPEQLDRATEVQARVLRHAAHVFTMSDWTRRSMIDDFGLSPERVTTAYLGPSINIPDGLSEPKVPREILFVGYDWNRKGGPLLLDALALLRERLPDVTLRVVTGQPLALSTPGVTVEGPYDQTDPAQFERLCRCYLRAACFCLPSLFEPFGAAIVEAATAGLPVVSVDTGSRREAVAHGETGLLAPERTPAALADALYGVLADPDRTLAMGRAARARAQSLFTWDRAITQILRVAAAALAARRADIAYPTPGLIAPASGQ
jgi:glycosyltransferase involved in cell wall biosynthesis